jgi:hypothetical protein
MCSPIAQLQGLDQKAVRPAERSVDHGTRQPLWAVDRIRSPARDLLRNTCHTRSSVLSSALRTVTGEACLPLVVAVSRSRRLGSHAHVVVDRACSRTIVEAELTRLICGGVLCEQPIMRLVLRHSSQMHLSCTKKNKEGFLARLHHLVGTWLPE